MYIYYDRPFGLLPALLLIIFYPLLKFECNNFNKLNVNNNHIHTNKQYFFVHIFKTSRMSGC